MYYVFLDSEAVNPQMEEIKKDIQDATSDSLVSTPTPDKNFLNTNDYTINYINTLLHPRNSYLEPMTTPISQFYSLNTKYCLTPKLRAEARTTTSDTATSSAPNTSSHENSPSNST